MRVLTRMGKAALPAISKARRELREPFRWLADLIIEMIERGEVMTERGPQPAAASRLSSG